MAEKGKILKLLLLLTLSLVALLKAAEIQLKAYVNKAVVGLNENFVYTVEISGTARSLPDVKLPDLSEFKILSGPSVSSSFQMINFQMSASKTYQFVLLPKKVGQFVIPPASATVDGQIIQSNSINLRVVPGTPQASSSPKQPPSVFLKVIASKKAAYLHEPITVIYKIYYRTKIANPSLVDAPEVNGAWQEEFQLKQLPQYNEMVNGTRYKVVEIYKMVLFPTRTGNITVTPMRLSLDIMEMSKRRDPFDPFFDDFFSSPFGKWKQTVLASNTVNIEVNPLPERGKPANFSGLVGQFRLSTFLDQTMGQTNQALSFRVKISGNGNTDFLTDLSLPTPSSFEVYEPKIKGTKTLSGGRFQSTKIFDYVLIPRVPGQYTIPPLEITYFDPEQEQYKTLRSPQYQLVIEKSADYDEKLARQFVPKEDVELIGQDIEFIHETSDGWRRQGQNPLTQPITVGLVVMPLMAFLSVWGVQRYRKKLSENVAYARRQRAARQARERLKEARRRLAGNAFPEFYSAVANALIGFVGDKTNRATSGLTQETIQQIFQQHQVPDEIQQQFFNCLQQADFKRFAPAQASAEEGHQCLQKAEQLLKVLSRYFD